MPDEKGIGVSVIMPAHNAEKMIGKAIESVLTQTHSQLELIVIDDCSTDNTLKIAKHYEEKDTRVHILENKKNAGVAYSRNMGIQASRYPWIAFLDSDDTWNPCKIDKQLSAVLETGASLCYSSYALVDEKGNKVRPDYLVPNRTSFNSLLKENVIGCSTVLVSAEVMKIFHFHSDFYHEDYVLWLEILRAGYQAVGCKEVLMNWLYREDSRSYHKRKSLKNRWNIYRDCMELSLAKSMYYIICYSVAGIHKYGWDVKW